MPTFAPLLLAVALPSSSPVLSHALEVTLTVDEGLLECRDTIALDGGGEVTVRLHRDLAVRAREGALLSSSEPRGLVREHRVRAAENGVVTLEYEGRIAHEPTPMPEEHARSFSESPGIISKGGVYLAPESFWYPRIGDELIAYTVEVKGLPSSWSSVTVASPTRERPVPGAYLIAGPFKATRADVDGVTLEVLLRGDDPALAARYLDVGRQYLRMYVGLLGEYPWSRFSVVEGFWETGYGMPSFTLLGPKVIRFPFLLHSSFPHELLHNWWGNGVYVDEGGGNWSEGLTAYLADHLVQEQRGKGDDYRRDALVRYADYVKLHDDVPLSSFSERSSRASEAVGYGKWMMVLHMLRRDLGDALFTDGLRRFYRAHRYRRATFDDLRHSFEEASSRDLTPFFSAWVTRAGAPTLSWAEVSSSRARRGAPHVLTVALEQAQAGPSFPLVVPVAVALDDGRTVYADVRFGGGVEREVARGSLELDARPLLVKVDPHYDVFRRLHHGEVTPSLSRTLGGERMLFVLPTLASDEETAAWRAFAAKICGAPPPKCRALTDAEVASLPSDAAVWVLGYGNSLRAAAILGAARHGARFDDGAFRAFGAVQPNGEHSLALALEHPKNPELGLAFVAADRTQAIEGLARKLPHYGKYGYLGFHGDEPANVLKGAWPARGSPLYAEVAPGGAAAELALEKRAPLASLPPPFDAAPLVDVVRELSSPAYQGRGYGSAGLEQAQGYVVAALRAAGFTGELSRCFDDESGPGGKPVRACNVVATVEGKDPSLPAVVVGAHLDHLGTGWPDAKKGNSGKVHPGANDNASGVAVLLALARKLRSEGARLRTVHLVFFTGEEAGLIGSRRFVAELGPDAAAKVLAMVNLDTVGWREGPFLVAGHESASEWTHALMGVGFVTGVESRMAAQGLGAGDHQAFLDEKIPAVHLFGGPPLEWHSPDDVAARVQPAALVDAAVLGLELVGWLAERETPLTASGSASPSSSSSSSSGRGRKVALGTIPDMSFAGPGVRLKGAMKGSPAERAGLREGDVLLRFNDAPVVDLRGLAEKLKEAKAGERVKLTVKRGSEEITVDVELVAR